MKPKVLVAIDGSRASLKTVDYVGEIACRCRDIEITLFHVFELPAQLLHDQGCGLSFGFFQPMSDMDSQKLREDNREMVQKEIFDPAIELLKAKGIEEATIGTKIATDSQPDTALAIIKEANTGGHNTVAMGKKGKSMLQEFMFGSVTSKVINHIKDCAIWLVE